MPAVTSPQGRLAAPPDRQEPPPPACRAGVPPSLRGNFLWTLSSNVIYAASQWLMLALLTKLGSLESVGIFAYALAATAPIFMLTNLQLRAILATDAGGEFSIATYVTVRALSSAIALVAISLVVFSFAPAGSGVVVLAMGVAKAMESLSDVLYGALQRVERMDLIGRSLIVRSIAGVTAFGVAICWRGGVLWGVIALGVAWAAGLLLHDLPTYFAALPRIRTTPAAPRRSSATLVVTALPLGFVMMLISLGVNVPRYFVEHHHGMGALGVYSAVSYILVAGSTVIGALGQALSPRLAVAHARGDDATFSRLLNLLLAFAGVTGVGGIVIAAAFGVPILRLLYSPAYDSAHGLFVWAMLAGAITYLASAFGFAATASRSFRGQAPVTAAMVAVTAIGSWALVPLLGLTGAIVALSLGQLVQGGGMYLLVRGARRAA